MRRSKRARFSVLLAALFALTVGTVQPTLGYVGSNGWTVTIHGPRHVKCEHRYKYEARVRDDSTKKHRNVRNTNVIWRMVDEPAGAADTINGTVQNNAFTYPNDGTPVTVRTRNNGKSRVFIVFHGAGGRTRTLRATAETGGSFSELDIRVKVDKKKGC